MEEIKKYKGSAAISTILIAVISLIVITIAIYTNVGFLITEGEALKTAHPNATLIGMLADFIPVGLMLVPFVLCFGMAAVYGKSQHWF